MAWARHGYGMASVNQTRPHCVNQMGNTHSKPLAARHGRGTAWARHAICELAFSFQYAVDMRRIILSFVACSAVPYYATLSHKVSILGRLLNIKNVI
jgi:hypothetical protein